MEKIQSQKVVRGEVNVVRNKRTQAREGRRGEDLNSINERSNNDLNRLAGLQQLQSIGPKTKRRKQQRRKSSSRITRDIQQKANKYLV